MKNLFQIVEFIIGLVGALYAMENAGIAGGGAAKKKAVLATMKSALSESLDKKALEDGGLEELLKIIGDLINAVVALLNFFGIFTHKKK